jgi:hypothetical protein
VLLQQMQAQVQQVQAQLQQLAMQQPNQQQQQHQPAHVDPVQMAQQMQTLQEQMQQLLASQQQQWGVPAPAQGPGSSASQHFVGDPFTRLLHPNISSNPHFATAAGPRVQGFEQAGSHNPQAVLVQLLSETVHQAVANSLSGMGLSAGGVGAAAAAAAGGGGGAAAAAGGQGAGSSQAAAAGAAAAPPKTREFQTVGSWTSLPLLAQWFCQVGAFVWRGCWGLACFVGVVVLLLGLRSKVGAGVHVHE